MNSHVTLETERFTPHKILQLIKAFSIQDLQWLVDQLNRLLEEKELPGSATIDEAIELFQADRCSLGRAAELANVTRWDLMDVMAARGTPLVVDSHSTIEEVDTLFDELNALENAGHFEAQTTP